MLCCVCDKYAGVNVWEVSDDLVVKFFLIRLPHCLYKVSATLSLLKQRSEHKPFETNSRQQKPQLWLFESFDNLDLQK